MVREPPIRSSVTRRGFLRIAGASAVALSLPTAARARLRRLAGKVRIGMISDLHHDLMHDGEVRMGAFLKRMADIKPHALMQLGDFAYPKAENRSVITPFIEGSPIPLHVIGNHDTDAGHTKEQCLEIWGMSGRHYGRDVHGLRILVLDANDSGSPDHRGGYPAYVGPEQVEWLARQLEAHAGPFLVASHQPLAGVGAVDNAKELQVLLSHHADKVALCVNGHTHIDRILRVGGVNYLHVNSASYYWVGGSHRHQSYPPEIHKAHPWIEYTCPYRDAVFSALTFDPASGTITIEGRESAWVGPSPAELGIELSSDIIHGEHVAPRTRSRSIERARR